MGCLPDINWETLDFWTISPVVPTFHNKMLCSSRIVAMHRLSLFQKHQGSPEKKKKTRKRSRDISCGSRFQSVFVGFIFQSCPYFFGGEGKRWSFLGEFLDVLHSSLVSRPRRCFLVHSGRMPRRSQSGPQKKSLGGPQGWSKLHYRKKLDIGCFWGWKTIHLCGGIIYSKPFYIRVHIKQSV